MMENHDASAVYNATNAPYLNNTLMTVYAHSTNYGDVLGSTIPSEPHYIWQEGGTNVYADRTFTSDASPSATNSTSSTAHVVTQLKTAANGRDWRAYQEDLNATTGACPIASSGFYAPKHDPFVFFQDVAGNPPSKTNTYCAAHHRNYTTAGFQTDLTANDVAAYTFITPNLCNDMHGAAGCSNACLNGGTACVTAGDSWLQSNVPAIISYINAHDGVLFIVWDEPEASVIQPFVVVGPHVKAAYTSSVVVNHSGYVKTIEEIMRLPILPTVTGVTDFSDFFVAGYFP